MQERVRDQDFELYKVLGSLNTADVLTKVVDWELMSSSTDT